VPSGESPAEGMAFDAAMRERERARGGEKEQDGGKVGVSAPRDNAAAIEEEMLAVHQQQHPRVPSSARAAPAGDDVPAAGTVCVCVCVYVRACVCLCVCVCVCVCVCTCL